MAEICKLLGIKKTRTCPLHPRGDGFVERFNRTLLSTVASILEPDKNQKDWDEKVPLAMLAYRSSVQESTSETPAMMMLGREVVLPIDLMMSSPRLEENEIEYDYTYQLREKLHDVHEAAREKLKLAAQKQAKTYDRNTQLRSFKTGDWVWLGGVPRKRGVCPKLSPKWSGPYLIVTKLSDVIYRIQQSKMSKPKIIHLDRLKLYQGPPMKNFLQESVRKNPTRPRRVPRRFDSSYTYD